MRKSSLDTLRAVAKPLRAVAKRVVNGESPRSAVANVAVDAVFDILEAPSTKAPKASSAKRASKAKRAPKASAKRASKAKRAPKASASHASKAKRAPKTSKRAATSDYCRVCRGPHRKHARRGVAT